MAIIHYSIALLISIAAVLIILKKEIFRIILITTIAIIS